MSETGWKGLETFNLVNKSQQRNARISLIFQYFFQDVGSIMFNDSLNYFERFLLMLNELSMIVNYFSMNFNDCLIIFNECSMVSTKC